jgi:hypothetical protein
VACCGLLFSLALAGLGGVAGDSPAVQAQKTFTEKQAACEKRPDNTPAAWQFARACCDWAEFATNRAQRAEIAEQGIATCRRLLAREPKSGPGHYYLGLNLGQLARTRSLGALRLVSQMEVEFTAAIGLDEQFDYAGADRSLGLLYRDAPAIGSIGSRAKARQHLERALALAADFPENRLNLMESELKWNERIAARRELKALEEAMPSARKKLAGPAWTASWADWDARLLAARNKLEEPARLDAPRH